MPRPLIIVHYSEEVNGRMAILNNYMLFTVFGLIAGKPWQNSFCYAVNGIEHDFPEGSISFTPQNLKDTMDPIWNDNGLILGLQSRYRALLPNISGYSVDGFRVIARSGVMLEPVQYEGGTTQNGTGTFTSTVDTAWTAMYCYASADNYGQVGAKLWLPFPDEGQKSGNNWNPAAIAIVNSTENGVLNSINSTTHQIWFRDAIAGSDAYVPPQRVVVARNRTTVAPASPPYKAIYKYDFPITGNIAAYTVGNFIPDTEVSSNKSRR